MGFIFGMGLGAGSELPMANGTWQELGEGVPIGLARMTF